MAGRKKTSHACRELKGTLVQVFLRDSHSNDEVDNMKKAKEQV